MHSALAKPSLSNRGNANRKLAVALSKLAAACLELIRARFCLLPPLLSTSTEISALKKAAPAQRKWKCFFVGRLSSRTRHSNGHVLLTICLVCSSCFSRGPCRGPSATASQPALALHCTAAMLLLLAAILSWLAGSDTGYYVETLASLFWFSWGVPWQVHVFIRWRESSRTTNGAAERPKEKKQATLPQRHPLVPTYVAVCV